MAPKKICVGIQNLKFACTKFCGYLKVVGTCSQNLNFVGTEICGYSKYVGTQICGYIKFVMIQNSR